MRNDPVDRVTDLRSTTAGDVATRHALRNPASDLALTDQSGEMVEGPVVGSFGVIGKTAARQLPALQMVAQAITADSFSRTRIVAAVAVGQVPVFLALHGLPPC